MNKKIIMLILCLNFVSLSYSDIIFGPKKNQEVGGVVGQIYMYLDKQWEDLTPGNYYDIDVYIENIATKKKYKTNRYDKGYFCLLNVPPGQYKLSKLDFYYEKYNTIYIFNNFKVYSIDKAGNIIDEGIKFGIHKDSITAMKTIFIYIKMMPNSRYEPYFKREGDIDHLKKFFKTIDGKNKWSSFDFIELEME